LEALRDFINEVAAIAAVKPKHVFKVVGHFVVLFLRFKDSSGKQIPIVQCLSHYMAQLGSFNDELKRKYSIVTLWKTFVIEILKKHFTNVEYMNVLTVFIEKLYTASNVMEKGSGLSLKNIYDMLVGHSKFLNVLIDEEEKTPLVKGINLVVL